MTTEFIRGQSLRFVAEISFGLNWDDKDMKSIKIRKGQEVLYDGEVAIVENNAGIISGRCMGLKSAINVMGWLKPLENGHVSKNVMKVVSENLFGKNDNSDYNPHSGGNFDTYMNSNNRGSKREIIKEEDLVVKKIPSLKSNEKVVRSGKLEIAGDQVEIPKERLVVSSSTIRPKVGKRDVEVNVADEMGADSTLPLKNQLGTSVKSQERKTFIVDETTPRQIREDMTREELQRITKVVKADDAQDAKIIKKIDTSNKSVQEVEGIVLKKISTPKDVKFNKVVSPSGLTIKTTVGAGSNSSVSGQGGVVVGVSKTAKGEVRVKNIQEKAKPLTEEEKKEALKKLAEREKKAKAKAEDRKKESIATQKLMEKEKKESTKENPFNTQEVPDLVEEIKLDDSAIKVSDPEATTDFLLMLPDNWNKMHWVKKEKFIKDIDDIFFIKFILSMELTKAVRNACLERLKQLEQEKSG